MTHNGRFDGVQITLLDCEELIGVLDKGANKVIISWMYGMADLHKTYALTAAWITGKCICKCDALVRKWFEKSDPKSSRLTSLKTKAFQGPLSVPLKRYPSFDNSGC